MSKPIILGEYIKGGDRIIIVDTFNGYTDTSICDYVAYGGQYMIHANDTQQIVCCNGNGTLPIELDDDDLKEIGKIIKK